MGNASVVCNLAVYVSFFQQQQLGSLILGKGTVGGGSGGGGFNTSSLTFTLTMGKLCGMPLHSCCFNQSASAGILAPLHLDLQHNNVKAGLPFDHH